MQLAQVYEQFGLTPKELEKLLDKHQIKVTLRHIKQVPAEWLAIIEGEAGSRPVAYERLQEIAVASYAEQAGRLQKQRTAVKLELLASSDDTPSQLGKVVGEVRLPAGKSPVKDRHHPQKQANKRNGQHRPQPLARELQLGQVVPGMRESYCFVRGIRAGVELFCHTSVLGGRAVAANEWLLFVERPSRKHVDKWEVSWAQPVGEDEALLRKALQNLDVKHLHSLLLDGPKEAQSVDIVAELFGRLEPIHSADSLAAAYQIVDVARQRAPISAQEKIEDLLTQTAPEFVWQLWLRYCSPLVGAPEAAIRLTRMLESEPSGRELWWPAAQQAGLAGLAAAYVQKKGKGSVVQSLEQVRIALGTTQSGLLAEVVSQWFAEAGEVSSAAEFRLYQRALGTAQGGDTKTLEQLLIAQLTPAVKLEVWLTGDEIPFPRAAALMQFGMLSVPDQDKAAAQLTDEELETVLRFLSGEQALITRQQARKILEGKISDLFSVLALDLESDTDSINEIAWGRPDAWHEGVGKKQVKAQLLDLSKQLIGVPNSLVVGHNARDFDAPILAAHGVLLRPKYLWDTLLVEMALSPEWRVFALQTSHGALADAKVAYLLFVSQVLRILIAESIDWEGLRELFAPEVQNQLAALRAEVGGGRWLAVDELKQDALSCLRPQPQASALLGQVRKQLAAIDAKVKMVLAPEEFWREMRAESEVRYFVTENTDPDFRELQEQLVVEALAGHPNEVVLARRFFAYCQQAGLAPVPATMAPVLRIRLGNLVEFSSCRKPPKAHEWQLTQCICLTVEQLLAEQTKVVDGAGAAILVVEPDLITLSHKKLLGEPSTDNIQNSPAAQAMWMKFSGGQSFAGLSKQQAVELGATVPAGFDSFWLEKHSYGNYRIWGRFNWENLIKAFAANKVKVVSAADVSFPKGQMRSAVLDAQRLQRRIGVTPFNPETIYRSRYWLLQFELVRRILASGKGSLVLLVQRPEEVEQLEAYFRSQGFYVPEHAFRGEGLFIPAHAIALGRRLELLHSNGAAKRLLVAPVKQAAAIMAANYLGPIEVLVDSFNLSENFYLAQGSKLFEKIQVTASEPARNDDLDTRAEFDGSDAFTSSKEEILERDLYFLLKLQLPVVQRLRTLLLDNHKDNRLWLLDPRLGDFPALEEAWVMQKTVFDASWGTEEEYAAAAEAADEVLHSPRPEKEYWLDTEEALAQAKSRLSQVFLNGSPWYDEQQPYLDLILPAKTDLLVSLPTGGGKSLLFQGPALYRSAFTNRLSIVVTPLKALMEDQVDALWKLGFYSSVEYINQDKKDEVQQIYRRLAGGEISLLYITPERFRSGAFTKAFLQRFNNDQGLEYAVYDEAHCISQWGHEFRPDYLNSAKVVQQYRQTCLPRRFPVLLFSATVSEKIYDSFKQLFE